MSLGQTAESTRGACRICGHATGNRTHRAREIQFGMDGEFDYLECGRCGCLQLLDVPRDLAPYYAGEYYSFEPPRERSQSKLLAALRRQRSRHWLGQRSLLGALLAATRPAPEHFDWFRRAGMGLDARVLDVGCGSGKLLLRLKRDGFCNLAGIDPHLERDVDAGGVMLRRAQLGEIEGPFDFVMLNHSFEHMADPLATLGHVRRVLAPGGKALLRIPVAGSYVWRKYGVSWGSLDAPRHLFLHTVNSLHRLAAQARFSIFDVVFDSTYRQFFASEMVVRNLPLKERDRHRGAVERPLMSERELAYFRQFAAELNRRRDGDTACFYLRPDG